MDIMKAVEGTSRRTVNPCDGTDRPMTSAAACLAGQVCCIDAGPMNGGRLFTREDP
ncbi:MAG: hypothetical protein MUC50_24505 [Myxococcota bacterium]|jgi:hypothetical protein|nr:hypothetical protein [Myxococcota bacterium]